MSNQQIGQLVVLAGIVAVVIGLIIWAGGLSWFGKLPGDVRIEGKNATVFIPVVSMLVVSLVLSVALSLLLRLLRR